VTAARYVLLWRRCNALCILPVLWRHTVPRRAVPYGTARQRSASGVNEPLRFPNAGNIHVVALPTELSTVEVNKYQNTILDTSGLQRSTQTVAFDSHGMTSY